jgi:FkbM family methyltransferase
MTNTDNLVLFGAGQLGRKILNRLHGIRTVEAFCDNNPAKWGSEIETIPVLSPVQCAQRFAKDHTFVVSVWSPSRTSGISDLIEQLLNLGCKKVVTFIDLFWEFPDLLLPHLFWQTPEYFASHRNDIEQARQLFDDLGRQEFDRQIALRFNGDFTNQIVEQGEQYFPNDLFSLSDDETFIDCGAFDGDTISAFVSHSKGSFREIIALEPDASNLSKLEHFSDRRIRILPLGASDKRQTLRFSTAAGGGSAISTSGDQVIETVDLDGVADRATYIKMDIEGSELQALRGAQNLIKKFLPRLAICAYHRPDDLWSIPQYLHELLPNSRLTLKTYNRDGFDCVCYCLP